MQSHPFLRWFAVAAMLALPVMASAQEATLSGTVTDTTGGALPGVTVLAVHEAAGNSFEAVTDALGRYRLPVRVGFYQVTAELTGFGPVTQTVTLLVGREAVVNLEMGVGSVQETVTVTGEAPLLDVTQSTLGGNIDPLTMQEVPLQGRNWMELVLLAPGARTNSVVQTPFNVGSSAIRGDFQLNIDGQQITNLVSAAASDGQPSLSRDSIAEFEYVSSRFNATQGRSSGVQINAITKSGTNTFSGSFAGYFRHDSLNAADFIAQEVLPLDNKQFSGTFGGPLLEDRIHFFGYFERETEPRTAVWNTAFPHFNLNLSSSFVDKKGGGRVDAQFTPRIRVTGRTTHWRASDPFAASGGSNSGSPSKGGGNTWTTDQVMGTLTQVLSNRAVNEIKVGYSYIFFDEYAGKFGEIFAPAVDLAGFDAGAGSDAQFQGNTIYNIRDDFTYSVGRHTIKLGGEYLNQEVTDARCSNCQGVLDATGGPIPDNDTLASLFPDLFDPSTWNLAPLSPLAVRFDQQFFTSNTSLIPRDIFGFWAQDDWDVMDRLTLNVGLRYDYERNAYANDFAVLPFVQSGRPDDTDNFAPRLGFTFSANEQTVVRGGFGLYFTTVTNPHQLVFQGSIIDTRVENDGRPDFASNPFNGPAPTFAELLTQVCTPEAPTEPGCKRRQLVSSGILNAHAPGYEMPLSYQTSIGLQRQLSPTMAVEADYVYLGFRGLPENQNINLTYDAATGLNNPFSDISRRPFPDWAYVNLTFNQHRYNDHSLQTAWTKRMSEGWQASATYRLGGLWESSGPIHSGFDVVTFPLAEDLGEQDSLSVGDQRHRAVFNGIWQLPYDFQVSGLYFFGSGERLGTFWGQDLRDYGSSRRGERRLRPDDTIIPRNDFVGKALHRVDLRFQRRFLLGGGAGIDGIVEVFNLFNHENFGRYQTNERSSTFLQPRQPRATNNVAFNPRTVQLGFRFTF